MTRPRQPSDMRVVDAAVTFSDVRLRTPLILSRSSITHLTLAHARVTVESPAGQRASGAGMIYLSDGWAWPSTELPHATRDAAMRAYARQVAVALPTICAAWGHPLELGMALHDAPPAAGVLPPLAVAVCASPFDAALHDAYGHLHGQSSYALLGPAYLPGDLAGYLGEMGRGVTLEQALALTWRPRVLGCVLIGAAEPLTPAEVTTPVGDGLPECLTEWVQRYGFFAAKVKPHARDPRDDAARTVAVYRVLRATTPEPWLSVDPNEGYPDADTVLAYLAYLREADVEAFHALRYIEQPVPRAASTTVRLAPASTQKPILVDEGVTGLDNLPELLHAGWSGIALKTCKGHTLCLLLAAWSRLHGLPYTLQDLTNPALAAQHALNLAARLDTLNGVELNALQFTPDVFTLTPRGGCHDASALTGAGLGYL